MEFQMTSRAITLGRNTPSSQVDFDLSLEAPAFKISRKQVWECASVKGGREERREGWKGGEGRGVGGRRGERDGREKRKEGCEGGEERGVGGRR